MIREHLAWGAVGGLSFLVLLQGYELVTGWRAPVATKLGVAALVTAAATAVAGLVGRRLAGNGSA